MNCVKSLFTSTIKLVYSLIFVIPHFIMMSVITIIGCFLRVINGFRKEKFVLALIAVLLLFINLGLVSGIIPILLLLELGFLYKIFMEKSLV